MYFIVWEEQQRIQTYCEDKQLLSMAENNKSNASMLCCAMSVTWLCKQQSSCSQPMESSCTQGHTHEAWLQESSNGRWCYHQTHDTYVTLYANIFNYSESRGLGTSCIYWTLMNATTIRCYCYVAAVGAKAHEKNFVKGWNIRGLLLSYHPTDASQMAGDAFAKQFLPYLRQLCTG